MRIRKRICRGDSGYLVYINILVGMLLKFLIVHIPGIKWYTVLQCLIVWGAMSIVSYVLTVMAILACWGMKMINDFKRKSES